MEVSKAVLFFFLTSETSCKGKKWADVEEIQR